MALLLKKLDTDLATVRLDLNAGGASGFAVVHDLDLGQITAANTYVSDASSPETYITNTKHGLVPVMFRLVVRDTSTDNLRTLAQALATELNRPGPYLVQLNGQSPATYFDVPGPADIGNMVRGQDYALHKITTQLLDPDGLPVTLYRLPYLYSALATLGPYTISNDPTTGTNKKLVSMTVTGNMRTRANVKVVPEAGSQLVQMRLGKRAYGDATSFAANWYQRGNGNFISGASANVTDSGNASSGGTLNLLSSNRFVELKRVRWTVNPGTPSGVEGTFRVYARVRASTTAEMRHYIQLRWGSGNTNPASFSNEYVTLQFPGKTGQTAYQMVDLGTVTVSTALGTTYGCSLEVWAYADENEGGTTGDDLYLDYVMLFPTAGGVGDQMQTISVRGFRDSLGGSGQMSWKGNQLTTPSGYNQGTPDHNVKVLTCGDLEGAGTPPAGGITLASGRHAVTASLHLNRRSKDASGIMGYLEAYDITGAVRIERKEIAFSSTTTTALHRDYTLSLTFDWASASLVQFRVYTLNTGAGDTAEIRVRRLTYDYTQTVANTQELHSDGDYALGARPTAYLTSSGVYNQPLSAEGAFLDLDPGTNVLVTDWGDLPAGATEDVDIREPLAKNVIDRDCTVTVTYRPRWSG